MKLKKGKKSKQQSNNAKRSSAAGGEFSIRTIVVPIDFSEHSKNALRYAIGFAKQFKSELVLVYVVEPTIYPADFSFGQVVLPSTENDLRDRGQQVLDELAATAIAESIPARTIVRVGKPFIEIINLADREAADIIIMATHGHTGVEHILFGGTAEKVLRKAHCPVLMLRAAEPT
jgi:nucleotide-binding universal stress UspA family protein